MYHISLVLGTPLENRTARVLRTDRVELHKSLLEDFLAKVLLSERFLLIDLQASRKEEGEPFITDYVYEIFEYYDGIFKAQMLSGAYAYRLDRQSIDSYSDDILLSNCAWYFDDPRAYSRVMGTLDLQTFCLSTMEGR